MDDEDLKEAWENAQKLAVKRFPYLCCRIRGEFYINKTYMKKCHFDWWMGMRKIYEVIR